MTTLLVGFDSAWTPTNSGALVGALRLNEGKLYELGPPQTVNFHEAERTILDWQSVHVPTETNRGSPAFSRSKIAFISIFD